MKRDMELARTLLARIESGDEYNGSGGFILGPDELGVPDRSNEEVSYHSIPPIEAGLLAGDLENNPPVLFRLAGTAMSFWIAPATPEVWKKVRKRQSSSGALPFRSDAASYG